LAVAASSLFVVRLVGEPIGGQSWKTPVKTYYTTEWKECVGGERENERGGGGGMGRRKRAQRPWPSAVQPCIVVDMCCNHAMQDHKKKRETAEFSSMFR
jgi:hypothetical protein